MSGPSRDSTLDDVRCAVNTLGMLQAEPFPYVELLGFLRGRGLSPRGVSIDLERLESEGEMERLSAATGQRWSAYGEDEGPMVVRVLGGVRNA